METVLFWSYDSRMNLYEESSYIIDLYRSSMIKAKSLGYRINFYCDKNVMYRFLDIVDSFYDISEIKFGVVDDLKLYIHSQHGLDCVTIDGDIILEERISFPNLDLNHVYFDFPETKKDILKEENNIYNGYGDLKRIFKKYKADELFPLFNYDNNFACNTGIIKFNNQKTKDLFLSEFKRIQRHFVESIEPLEKSGLEMRRIRFILAQYYYGCMIDSLKIPVYFLFRSNRYEHFYGNKKFEDRAKNLVYNILKK